MTQRQWYTIILFLPILVFLGLAWTDGFVRLFIVLAGAYVLFSTFIFLHSLGKPAPLTNLNIALPLYFAFFCVLPVSIYMIIGGGKYFIIGLIMFLYDVFPKLLSGSYVYFVFVYGLTRMLMHFKIIKD